jgi:hypothetical protein
MLEADLVLAMCESRFRDRVDSSGRTQDTVRRFTARVDDAAQRQALEDLFPGDGTLEHRLEQVRVGDSPTPVRPHWGLSFESGVVKWRS